MQIQFAIQFLLYISVVHWMIRYLPSTQEACITFSTFYAFLLGYPLSSPLYYFTLATMIGVCYPSLVVILHQVSPKSDGITVYSSLFTWPSLWRKIRVSILTTTSSPSSLPTTYSLLLQRSALATISILIRRKHTQSLQQSPCSALSLLQAYQS